MAYSVYIDASGPWLVIEYAGPVGDKMLVTSRAEAAALNASGRIRDFILDFTDVTELVLDAESVQRIGEIDRAQTDVVPSGRCAIVAQRDTVELGTSYLGAVSPLALDFRAFRERSTAEAWLRGDLPNPPPPLPRTRRR